MGRADACTLDLGRDKTVAMTGPYRERALARESGKIANSKGATRRGTCGFARPEVGCAM